MTIHGDDADEMFRRHHLDDAAIDRILSGRAVPGENELVSFAEDVQIATTGTPVPSAALLGVFAEGLSNVKGDLSATAASNVTGPELQAAGLPQTRSKNMLEIALAKLGTMALAAKLGVAAGAVTLAGSAAAATGTLPAPAQDFASDAASRAGIEIPASAGRQDAEHRQDAERRQDAGRRADADGRQDAEHRQDDETVKAEEDGTDAGTDSYGTTVSGGAQELEPGDGREFGEKTASVAPKAPQAADAPTAYDNPGTTARAEAPVPAGAPAADDDVDGDDAAPEERPTAENNPGSSRRP